MRAVARGRWRKSKVGAPKRSPNRVKDLFAAALEARDQYLDSQLDDPGLAAAHEHYVSALLASAEGESTVPTEAGFLSSTKMLRPRL